MNRYGYCGKTKLNLIAFSTIRILFSSLLLHAYLRRVWWVNTMNVWMKILYYEYDKEYRSFTIFQHMEYNENISFLYPLWISWLNHIIRSHTIHIHSYKTVTKQKHYKTKRVGGIRVKCALSKSNLLKYTRISLHILLSVICKRDLQDVYLPLATLAFYLYFVWIFRFSYRNVCVQLLVEVSFVIHFYS